MNPEYLQAMELLRRLSEAAAELCEASWENEVQVEAVEDVLNDYYRFTKPFVVKKGDLPGQVVAFE